MIQYFVEGCIASANLDDFADASRIEIVQVPAENVFSRATYKPLPKPPKTVLLYENV
jgi:hypothetical protein